MINEFEKVAVIRRNGYSIYGRVVDISGKLGRYEVHSEYWRSVSHWAIFREAENELARLELLEQKRNKQLKELKLKQTA